MLNSQDHPAGRSTLNDGLGFTRRSPSGANFGLHGKFMTPADRGGAGDRGCFRISFPTPGQIKLATQ
jgi:hypothetical protein